MSLGDALIHEYRTARLRLPQPWSRRFGQLVYAPRLLRGDLNTRREFAEEPVIARLALGDGPIDGVRGPFTERVIEIPWVLRRVAELRPASLLDVGTAFAPMIYKWLLARQPARVETADLAPADILALPHHVADIRELPFADQAFELASCISTLEHIGMDNRQYEIQSGGGGDVVALRELGRVAGRVLVTVPAGRDEDMGYQRQYSPERFRRAAGKAGLAIERLDVFEQTEAGWNPVEPAAIADRTYGQGATAAAALLCAQLSRQA